LWALPQATSAIGSPGAPPGHSATTEARSCTICSPFGPGGEPTGSWTSPGSGVTLTVGGLVEVLAADGLGLVVAEG
jgi:hypothetical protein